MKLKVLFRLNCESSKYIAKLFPSVYLYVEFAFLFVHNVDEVSDYCTTRCDSSMFQVNSRFPHTSYGMLETYIS